MQRCLAILLVFAAISSQAIAALFQGQVLESNYGVGIDSVKVMLRGKSDIAYTDSAGRFSLGPSTALLRTLGRNAELIWQAKQRRLIWTEGTGAVSITVTNALGHIELKQVLQGSGPGHFRVTGLEAGIHFALIQVGGQRLAWHWYENDSPAGSASLPFPALRDIVFAIGARQSLPLIGLDNTGIGDTLVFEKKGFEVKTQFVDGSDANLKVKLTRKPIRVLIIEGMSNHEWKQTTRILKGILTKAGFFQVDVSTAPNQANSAAWQAWDPRFTDYDLVLNNYNSGDALGSLRWPRDKEIQLQEFVKGGGGLYAFHAANNAFSQWSEYNQMIATGWRTKNFGYALEIGQDGQVIRIAPGLGGDTQHGNRAEVLVQRLRPHPIHKGYPPNFKTTSLEIYQFARGPAENCEVLSYAFDGPTAGNSKRNWPIELLVTYGKGQVYNSTMGHVWAGDVLPDAVRDVAFQTALIRASEWLARREVLYPLPKSFNTASQVVYEDVELR